MHAIAIVVAAFACHHLTSCSRHHMVRHRKMSYPCVQCKKKCTENVIECSSCTQWVHMEYVSMDLKCLQSDILNVNDTSIL